MSSGPAHDAIPQSGNAFLRCTMGGTKQNSLCVFRTMSDDPAAAVVASWRQPVYRALETVEHVGFVCKGHFKRFVVVVSAHFTSCHDSPPSPVRFAVRSPNPPPTLVVAGAPSSFRPSALRKRPVDGAHPFAAWRRSAHGMGDVQGYDGKIHAVEAFMKILPMEKHNRRWE